MHTGNGKLRFGAILAAALLLAGGGSAHGQVGVTDGGGSGRPRATDQSSGAGQSGQSQSGRPRITDQGGPTFRHRAFPDDRGDFQRRRVGSPGFNCPYGAGTRAGLCRNTAPNRGLGSSGYGRGYGDGRHQYRKHHFGRRGYGSFCRRILTQECVRTPTAVRCRPREIVLCD